MVHEACKHGHTVVVMMLLTFGADPNKCDEWGNSPLMYAVLNGHTETVRQLVRGGCNVNSVSRINHTALHTAAENGGQDIVKILVEAGADPDICDKNGNTPLLLAASCRFPLIMTLLLDSGAGVQAVTALGRSALHFAALHMYTKLAARLLEAGAPPDNPDHLGCTPLTLAVSRNFTPIIHMLLRLNCRVDRVVKDTPLLLVALKHGDASLLRLLVEAGADCSPLQQVLGVPSGGALGVAPLALPTAVTDNKRLMTWLYDISSNPRTLRDLSAVRVRGCLSHAIQETAHTLLLPHTLQTRLLLQPYLPASNPSPHDLQYSEKDP